MSKIIGREINTLEEIVNRETWRRGKCNLLPPSSFAIQCFYIRFLSLRYLLLLAFVFSLCSFQEIASLWKVLFCVCVFMLSIEPRVNGKVTRVYFTNQYAHVCHYSFVCCYYDSKKNPSNRHPHYIYWKKKISLNAIWYQNVCFWWGHKSIICKIGLLHRALRDYILSLFCLQLASRSRSCVWAW